VICHNAKAPTIGKDKARKLYGSADGWTSCKMSLMPFLQTTLLPKVGYTSFFPWKF
jgi:hypothetical protein